MEVQRFSTCGRRQITWILVCCAFLATMVTFYGVGDDLGLLGENLLGPEHTKISKSLEVLSKRIGIPVGVKGANLTDAESKILQSYLRGQILIRPIPSSGPVATSLDSLRVSGRDRSRHRNESEPTVNSTIPLENKIRQLLAGQRSGFYVESRARDGHNFHSFTRNVLERELGWTGLLVEPVPELVNHLATQHRRAWIAKACLSLNFTEYMEYFWIKNYDGSNDACTRSAQPPLKLIPPSKLELDRNLNGRPNRIVECFPLHHILAAINVTEIDLFVLDVDGNEYKVLNHIPQTVPIKIIILQHRLAPEGRNAFKGLMYARRYYLTFESDSHYIFIRMKFLLGPILAEL